MLALYNDVDLIGFVNNVKKLGWYVGDAQGLRVKRIRLSFAVGVEVEFCNRERALEEFVRRSKRRSQLVVTLFMNAIP